MTHRPEDVDEAIVEYFELLDRGECVDPDRFIARHPDLADPLREFFDAATVVQQMAGPTRDQQSRSSPQGDTAESSIMGTNAPERGGAQSPQIATPCQFGRYRVERELGQGAMGSVYLAHDAQLEREVALKIPGFDQTREPEMIERFYREARAAAALRSPHICPVYDVDQIDGVHFIAMAYIDGQPLSRWMAQNRACSPQRIAAIVHKLAQALEKAHEAGVVHRDLKPSNIMIDGDGEPVVMDFGLARRIDRTEAGATKAGTLVGTPAYMAPEQILGDSDAVGPASDIYALGVILYELLTGRLPFEGSVISVIGQIVAGQPQPPEQGRPEIDPRLAAACKRMMAKRIEDRYQSMADVAAALEPCVHGAHEQAFDAVADVADPPVRAPAPRVSKAPAPESHQARQPRSAAGAGAAWAGIVAAVLAVMLVGGCLVLGIGYRLLTQRRVEREAELAARDRARSAMRRAEEELRSAERARRPPAENDAAAPSRPLSSVPGLQYDWQPETSYGYSLRMTAKRGSLSETLTGTLRYRVLEANKKETKLLFDSKLSSSVRSGFVGPPGADRVSSFAPLSDVVRMFPRHELTVDRRGRVVQNGCDASLPFGLGSLAQLVIETFPERRSDRWEITRRTTLELKHDLFPFSRGPFGRPRSTERIDAVVTTNYTLASCDANAVALRKQIEVAVPAESPLAVSGEGETRFDRKRGVVTEMRCHLKVSDGSGAAVGVDVDGRLLTDMELAERLKSLETAPVLSLGQRAKVDSLSKPPDPSPGKPITDQTPLAPGDGIQGYKSGGWRDVTVLENLDDGRVRVHWVGFGSEWDEAVPRSRLRIPPGADRRSETDSTEPVRKTP